MTGDRFHPWRLLRGMEEWSYFTAELPPGVRAVTRWSDRTIWLRPGLTQVERRCVLAHELEHARRGRPCLKGKDETAVVQATARRLVPLDALIDAARWTSNLDEAASELWVTPGVLRTRIQHLHPAEHHAIKKAISEGRDLNEHE